METVESRTLCFPVRWCSLESTAIYSATAKFLTAVVTRNLLFEETLKILQVANTDVGYRPVSEVAVSPVDQGIALAFHRLLLFAIRGCRRPDKQVNKMLALLINQSCYRVGYRGNQGVRQSRENHHRRGPPQELQNRASHRATV